MDLKKAGEFIRGGGLVAFPTETVYGLGADAFNSEAVARIYAAKGRPSDNPLILHVSSPESFAELAHEPPGYAFELIRAFWPGSLTIVANKKPSLPRWLGGHPERETGTVGIRMPANPVAKALIEASGCVIAAPSANKAGRPSPTSAAHVLEDFPEAVETAVPAFGIMLLDGGSVDIGLESTVVDVTGECPKILRPGAVTAEDIRKATGLDVQFSSGETSNPRSPGMKYRHYAPRAPMFIVSGEGRSVAAHIMNEWGQALNKNQKAGALICAGSRGYYPEVLPVGIELLISGGDEKIVAKNLFACLRQFDTLGVSVIYAEAVRETGLGLAIGDRMRKAAEGRVINV